LPVDRRQRTSSERNRRGLGNGPKWSENHESSRNAALAEGVSRPPARRASGTEGLLPWHLNLARRATPLYAGASARRRRRAAAVARAARAATDVGVGAGAGAARPRAGRGGTVGERHHKRLCERDRERLRERPALRRCLALRRRLALADSDALAGAVALGRRRRVRSRPVLRRCAERVPTLRRRILG